MSDGKGKSNHYSPVKQAPKTGFMAFLWNSETGEFLGRTAGSWFKITVFYIFFFAGLAAFFGLMLYIFLLTLNPAHPKWMGEDGLIGSNPGVGFRPMPDQDKNVESTLIWLDQRNERKDSYWTKELVKYFDKFYTKVDSSGNAQLPCDYNGQSSTDTQACQLDITSLPRNCTKDNDGFGYENGNGKPCVLIKLNKIYGWRPEPYATLEDMKLARERGMPAELINHIEKIINGTGTKSHLNTTWVTCEGENPSDRENIGPLAYFVPGQGEFRGIPNYFFPYKKQDNYRAPFVFVKFLKPQNNVLIQIECKAWAKNIRPNRQERLGSVHFELMMD